MAVSAALLLPALLLAVQVQAADQDPYRVPRDFLLGAATSAYQTEGAWNEEGKGMSIFDYAVHVKNLTIFGKGANGDIASDGYHHIDDDVAMLVKLKFNTYRFTLPWARLLPSGYDQPVNDLAVKHYKYLIQKLIDNNIEPMIVLMHFDAPYNSKFSYNWFGPELGKQFANYARVAFDKFGDQVKRWITINEPDMFCSYFVTLVSEVSPYTGSGDPSYDCLRYQLVAHGRAYRVYEQEFKQKQKGVVGMSIIPLYARPNTTKYEDEQASIRFNTFRFGLTVDPVLYGDFHPLVRKRVQANSEREGRKVSRLPEFTAEEKKIITNTLDFLGLNIYYGSVVADGDIPFLNGSAATAFSMITDAGVIPVGNAQATSSSNFGNAFQRADPWVMRETLLWVRDQYNNPVVYITENGYESLNDTLHDTDRDVYYSEYLRAMMRTINEDNSNVKGYYVWSLIDTYEWSRGYTSKMGLVRVDFSVPERTRTIRDSHKFFNKVMEGTVPLVLSSSAPALLASLLLLVVATAAAVAGID